MRGPTFSGIDEPESGDIPIPEGARFRVRGTSEGLDANFLVQVLDDDENVLNEWDDAFTHSTIAWGYPNTREFASRWLTAPADVAAATLFVTGFGPGGVPQPLPMHISVSPTLEVELPEGECDRPDEDFVRDRAGENPSNGEGGDPVITATGSFLHRPEGLGVLGPLAPTYNAIDGWSRPDQTTGELGVLGPSWTSLLDVAARQVDTGATMDLRLASGRSFELPSAGTHVWTPPAVLDITSMTYSSSSGHYVAVFETGETWTFDDGWGRLVEIDDGRGGGIVITRASNGVPTRVETRVGGLPGHAWTVVDTGEVGLVDEIVGPFDADLTTAPAGTPQVDFTFDPDHRLTTISAPHPLASTVAPLETFSYERAGLIERVTRHRGSSLGDIAVVTNTFDGADRVIEQVTATGEVDHFTYDRTSTGWDTTIEHHDGSTVETVVYRHDEAGRLISIEDPYAESAAREWDRDLLTSSTARRGGEVTAAWDAAGRPTGGGLADPVTPGAQAGATAVTYCGPGDPRTVDVTDAAGVVTRTWWTTGTDPYACDPGRSVPVKVTHAHGTALAADTTYTSADGLVTSTTDADGVRTDYSWEPGRALLLSSTDYPQSPSNPGRTTYYGYDAAGRRLVVRDPGGVETWTLRDAAGRVTSQVGPVAVSRTCGVTSCAFGTTPPSDPTRSWSYDRTGELLSATDQAGKTTTSAVTYPSGGGRVETVTEPPHGDDVTDPLSQVATVTTSIYDRFDRLTSVTVGDPGTPATLATTTYTYDPLGRLRQTSQEVGGGQPDLVESYSYDADGNQTRVTHGSTPTDTARAIAVRRYDLRGRLVEEWGPTGDTSAPSSVSGSSAVAVRQHTQWVYDQADRLLATIVGDGAEQQTTFQRYDAAGRLRYVIVDRDGDQAISAGSTGGPTDDTDQVTEHVYTGAGRIEQTVAPPVNLTAFDWIGGDQADKNRTTYAYDLAGQLVSSTDPGTRSPPRSGTAEDSWPRSRSRAATGPSTATTQTAARPGSPTRRRRAPAPSTS